MARPSPSTFEKRGFGTGRLRNRNIVGLYSCTLAMLASTEFIINHVFYSNILNQIPTTLFYTGWLAIGKLRVLIWQGSPTDRKVMRIDKIGNGALIINTPIYKSSSIIISSFSVMRSLGESLRIHYNYWPET